jgi:YidC/Oxa1 family membrane protein insertase
MERRVLLAIFLAFIVLYLWQAFVVPPPPDQTAPAQEASAPAPATVAEPGGQAAAQPQAPESAPSEVLVGAAAEEEFRIETADVVAVFTNRGGRLKSWRLKNYLGPDGTPHQLVATALATQPLPFSLRVPDEALTRTLNESLYVQTTADPAGAVSFEYRDASGIHIVKEFQVAPDAYVVTFRATVTQGDKPLTPAIEWGPAIGNPTGVLSSFSTTAQAIYFRDGSVERLAVGDIGEQPVQEGNIQYAGVEDHYFLVAAIDLGSARVVYRPVAVPPVAGSEGSEQNLVAFTVEPAAGTSVPIRVFVGPKDIDVLAGVNPNLVRAINFGMFSVIVVPLLRTLNWIYGFVGNYGWAIVLLTIFLNALMFPLRHKSVVSMRKMQEIQPEAKAIQERYSKLKATDPGKQKMNQELMALYRERGVNPASGCVPMLLTMPVLFALYALLTVAIELRGAPFGGWIRDLSAPDPFFVLPILMGASQFWQQWTAPQTGMDPAQQKMMLVMPLIMTVFFLWMPAGVALYLFVSNLWGIGQQYMTNYLIGPPNVRAVRPPAERRVKRVGAGPTEAAAREK